MSDSSPSEAVVICTRNRPDELVRTLRSVAVQSGAKERLTLIVDGSDSQQAQRTSSIVEDHPAEFPVRYHRYEGRAAQTRQRNKSIELLPSSVELVHFIDDDVDLGEKYFKTLEDIMAQRQALLGVGGLIVENESSTSRSSSLVHRLFLLGGLQPGRVLPSGHTTAPDSQSRDTLQPVEWLSTCSCCYRRDVFKRHQFDSNVEGPSPTLHDLDFSYRVAQDGPLAIMPTARLVHRRAPRTRRGVRETARERVPRRYWFVEKNLDTVACRLAFWWSIVGKLIILLITNHPNRDEALRGFLRGLRSAWTRDHELLRSNE